MTSIEHCNYNRCIKNKNYTKSQAVARIGDRILPHSRLSSNYRLYCTVKFSTFNTYTYVIGPSLLYSV